MDYQLTKKPRNKKRFLNPPIGDKQIIEKEVVGSP